MVPQCYALDILSPPLTSRRNPIVARYRSVAHGEEPGLLLLDGAHLVAEALGADLAIEHALAVAPSGGDEIAGLLTKLSARGIDTAIASSAVMAGVSPLKSPSAIVAIARRPHVDAQRMYARTALVLIVVDVQDPGNMGAVVRVAEAAGATGVLAAGISADPFGWKALRGAMGSTLRLPVARVADAAQATADARAHGCRVIAASPRGGQPLFDADLHSPTAVLIGGEGPGLSDALLDAADARVTIPMQSPVESLNAAVAAAIVAYEARRQRDVRSVHL